MSEFYLTKADTRRAGIPDEHYGHLLSDIEPRNDEQKKLIGLCEKVLAETDNKKRRTLVVLGTVGNGKSLIACSALQTFLNFHVEGAKYITQEKLIGRCRDGLEKRTENSIVSSYTSREVRLLVIDELSLRGWSEYTRNVIQRIISERHDNVLSTILIGNLDNNELKEMFDEHIISRLRLGDTLAMKAKDMRKHEEV